LPWQAQKDKELAQMRWQCASLQLELDKANEKMSERKDLREKVLQATFGGFRSDVAAVAAPFLASK
jgi:hypothetical protein